MPLLSGLKASSMEADSRANASRLALLAMAYNLLPASGTADAPIPSPTGIQLRGGGWEGSDQTTWTHRPPVRRGDSWALVPVRLVSIIIGTPLMTPE